MYAQPRENASGFLFAQTIGQSFTHSVSYEVTTFSVYRVAIMCQALHIY